MFSSKRKAKTEQAVSGSSDAREANPEQEAPGSSEDARNSQREWVLKLEREAEQSLSPTQELEEERAAARLQGRIRGQQSRKKTAAQQAQQEQQREMEEAEAAATQLQSRVRGQQQRKSMAQRIIESTQQKAATIVQSRLRGQKQRKDVQIQHDAAIKVQARVRGQMQRTAMTREAAACKIQGLYRCKAAQRNTRCLIMMRRAEVGLTDAAGMIFGSDWIISPRPSKEAIEMPTPAARWWTREFGWSTLPGAPAGMRSALFYASKPPSNVLPPAITAPFLFPDKSEAIGELCVEVLEAESLPRGADTFSSPDAYMLLVFEGCVAQTTVVWNRINPGWGAESSCRAFKFPVHHPYSTLCLAMMESDSHAGFIGLRGLQRDDILGRATVRLGSLYQRTTYDCWLPLVSTDTFQNREVDGDFRSYLPGRAAAKVGEVVTDVLTEAFDVTEKYHPPRAQAPAVRVRFSVTFASEQARMFGYIAPLPVVENPPTYDVPFDDSNAASHYRGAKFALFGPVEPIGEYKWQVLMAHVEELRQVGVRCEEALIHFEQVLFWKPEVMHLSLFLFVGFQLVVAQPQYLPLAMVICMLLNLRRTYVLALRSHTHSIHQRPGFWEIVGSLLPELVPASIKDPYNQLRSKLPSLSPLREQLERRAEGLTSQVERYRAVVGQLLNDSVRERRDEGMGSLLLYPRVGPLHLQQQLIRLQVDGYLQNKKHALYAQHGDMLLDESRAAKVQAAAAKKRKSAGARSYLSTAAGGLSTAAGGIRSAAGAAGSAARNVARRAGNYIPLRRGESKETDDDSVTVRRASISAHAAAAHEKTVANSSFNLTNPLAVVLGPVQDALGVYAVLPLRAVTSLLSWDDPFVTTWLCVGLVGLGVVFALIPWGFVCFWGMRAFGIAAFGPHMYFYGQKLERAGMEMAQAEKEFEQKTDEEKQDQMRAFREKLMKEQAEALLEKAATYDATKRERIATRAHFLEASSRRILVPMELNASRVVPGADADPARSSTRTWAADPPPTTFGASGAAEMV